MKKQTANVEKTSGRTIDGLEKHFVSVLVANGVAFVTLNGEIHTTQEKIVRDSGMRVTKRTNFFKQSHELALKVVRKMFDLKGRHIEVAFLAKVGDKIMDERGKDVIMYSATPAAGA